MSEQELSRRRFIRAATAATAASALAGALRSQEETNAPGIAATGAGTLRRVKLGRTGEVVPIIGMGTAPAGFHRELEEAASLFDEAIDLGVNYMDTAPHFTGYGKAQPALGRVFKKRRDKVFLERPLLVKGDGPITEFRRWYEQFYEGSRPERSGVGDTTPSA